MLERFKEWKYWMLYRAYSRTTTARTDQWSLDEGVFRSPLDIPARTVWRMLLWSGLITLAVGSTVLLCLRLLAMEGRPQRLITALPSVEMRNDAMGIPGMGRYSQKDTAERAMVLCAYLLPDWKTAMRIAKTKEKGYMIAGLADDSLGGITVARLETFLRHSLPLDANADSADLNGLLAGGSLRKMIVGEFNWYGIPVFSPKRADELADHFGLEPSVNKDPSTIDKATWRRYLFMSAVQKMRDQLDDGLTAPRRLLLALGGAIQWLTFIAAVWCLLLLRFLRLPWIGVQMRLVNMQGLPVTGQGKGVQLQGGGVKDVVFDLQRDPPEFARLDRGEIDGAPEGSAVDTRTNGESLSERVKSILVGRMGDKGELFLAPKLIKDCIRYRHEGGKVDEQLVRDRVNAYRSAVEMGEYEIVNFLMWAAPTFGFIGTIFGIIGAMESASSIFSAPTPVEQAIALDKVSSSLGTAFDTTFVALIWLVPMSFVLARVRKREADFFEQLEQAGCAALPAQLSRS